MFDSVILWIMAHRAPLSRAFSRQEYWSELPCPPPGDLPDPGIEPTSPVSPARQVLLLQEGSLPLVPPLYFHLNESLDHLRKCE